MPGDPRVGVCGVCVGFVVAGEGARTGGRRDVGRARGRFTKDRFTVTSTPPSSLVFSFERPVLSMSYMKVFISSDYNGQFLLFFYAFGFTFFFQL